MKYLQTIYFAVRNIQKYHFIILTSVALFCFLPFSVTTFLSFSSSQVSIESDIIVSFMNTFQ